MGNEVKHLVGIAPFVVIPGDELYKMLVQADTCTRIENGGAGIGVKVGRNNGILRVADDALPFRGFGSRLHHGLDFIIACALLKAAGQIHNGNIRRGHAQAHAGQLAVEGRNDLAHSLCSTGRARDNVVRRRAAAAPILLGWAVNGLLCCSDGMHRCHQALDDAEVVVNDLGKRRKAVGCAACVGDNVHVLRVRVLVHAHHKHRRIGGRCGNDDLLRAALKVLGGLFGGGVNAGGFHDVFRAARVPRDIARVHDRIDRNFFSIHNKLAVPRFHFAAERAVHGIVLGHIDHIVQVDKRIVNAHNVDFRVVCRRAQHQAANPAEAVDANFNCHFLVPPKNYDKPFKIYAKSAALPRAPSPAFPS